MMLSTRALPDITSSPEVWQVFKIRTIGKPDVFLPEVFSRFFFIVYLKFGFSEKATKYEKIFVVLLTRATLSVRATAYLSKSGQRFFKTNVVKSYYTNFKEESSLKVSCQCVKVNQNFKILLSY